MTTRWRAEERRGGFALVEAVAIAVVLLLLAVMLIVAGRDVRRQARLGEDIAKLRGFGSATGSYGADNADLFWTFSWKKGHTGSQWPDLNEQAQGSDNSACAAQGVDILRRLAGRSDIAPIVGFYPHWQYSHLPLTEYLAGAFPNVDAVSSADKHRLTWARNPAGFDTGLYQPSPTGGAPAGSNNGKRWPYSASFQVPTAFSEQAPVGSRTYQPNAHNLVWVGSQLGPRRLSEASHPSEKVHMHDRSAWHFGRVAYATHNEARLPLLFVDGNVAVRAAAESNPGWRPNEPAYHEPTYFVYAPDAWEPPALEGSFDQIVGRFRWTRGQVLRSAVSGRDFDGPETCSGQPGCP